MIDRNKNQTNKKHDNSSVTNTNAGQNMISQTGKSPQEMLPFLLSGEPDDLSNEFFDKV